MASRPPHVALLGHEQAVRAFDLVLDQRARRVAVPDAVTHWPIVT
ncbi:MAG: hypothetical protein AVDCRST_MAG89-5081 [uncultured Gemmatimonadetes bacterium]|uniref:Uncharacterized protein n=1 Tax=uncultured Gemmatimonadota bacterium TaxID=203437 RepID=A0A6J4N7A6_9BACT|nr:MAG: hypothetical protein AVDCRST_MAG89-5081 [uncultured Gemmatimonadota bacterium]